MITKIIPVFALLLGLVGGGAAAYVFFPEQTQVQIPSDEIEGGDHKELNDFELVKLPNQFVIPVLVNRRTQAMMILTLAIEVENGQGDAVRTAEPRLRDVFLGELFNLAALDGFRNEKITRSTLDVVKKVLTQQAEDTLVLEHAKVLITDVARQDVH